jgi:hypothetical protein
MTTDYRARALLAQPEPTALTGPALEDLRSIELLLEEHEMVACTLNIRRVLEAQPEPVAPTDEELISPIMWMIDECVYDNDKGEIAESLRELIARWGTPANIINQEDYE